VSNDRAICEFDTAHPIADITTPVHAGTANIRVTD